MAQRHAQRPRIAGDERRQAAFDGAVEQVRRLVVVASHEMGANHRGQGQRHQRRHDHREGEGQRELAEEAAHDAAHEEQRHEGRDERQADRDHREADLPRAQQGRGDRAHAALDVAGHVLDHDDGVVDHEADRDRDGHERQVVEAEACDPHAGDGAGERQRHRDTGRERRRRAAQEQEHHAHHERAGDQQGDLDVAHRGADRHGAVGEDRDVDAGRDPPSQLRQERFHAVYRLDDVGRGLLRHDQQNGRPFVEPARGAPALVAPFDRRDIGEPHDRAALAPQHDGAELLGRRQAVARGQRLGQVRPVEGADRLADVGIADGGPHGIDRKPHGGESLWIDADPDRRLGGTVDRDLGHAVDLADLLRNHGVGGVVERRHGQGLGGQRQDEDRKGRRIGLAVDRQGREVAGQVGGGRVQRRLHVACRVVDVAVEVELQRDGRGAERRVRRHLVDAGDLAETPFERRRDGGRHDAGVGPGSRGLHPDGRKIDRRQARDGQLEIAHDAHQEQPDRQQRRADRPPDEGRGNVHGARGPRTATLQVRAATARAWSRVARDEPMARASAR